ncbi:proline iminopeptidase-family hydrolase [Arenimonas sp.]|uniref:proline iminopeptidase-family hydrolase n=1 Tax=Arenimonas sp. TaxID=1872635 RepID=UPI0039E614ED
MKPDIELAGGAYVGRWTTGLCRFVLIAASSAALLAGCTFSLPGPDESQAAKPPAMPTTTPNAYFDSSGRDDVLSGGVRMIPIDTPKGKFRVWTKRIGNNPRIKVLLLHGGPAATHEIFEAFDSYFPGEGIEYYYYDQLGSTYSDQPKEPSLWEIDRFVDEVEQVRQALKLDKQNFYLYGQSWGGLLGIEYALKHQDHLKGLIVSNMMSSIPAYNEYAKTVLMPQMDPAVLKEVLAIEAKGDYANPRYEELLIPNFYTKHFLRMPPEQWPEPVMRGFSHLNKDIYVPMQGPSEMGASGKLVNWNRSAQLKDIRVPTLVIGARYDTMDPAHMEWMSKQFPHGRYLYCPEGSHLALYDDQETYMAGLIGFLKDVDGGKF